MIIDVADISPPGAGKKMARITSSTGQAYQIWPDKLGRIHVGGRYEIETRDREWEGRTYVSIVKIEPAAEPPPARPSTGEIPQLNAAKPPSPHAGEAEYVGRVLAALIAAGQVDLRSLVETTQWLRMAWRTEPLTEPTPADDVPY